MDDHKLVMISIFYLQNMRDMQFFFFYENMLNFFLEFGRMQRNIFFFFLKMFSIFFLKYFGENRVF
jgi:hypothetical protein